MTIPASSSNCERLFSQLNDLLQLKRRKIGAQLLAALQCVRSWVEAGFMSGDDEVDESTLTDSTVEAMYNVSKWDASPLLLYHSDTILVYSANILPDLSNKSNPNTYKVFQVNAGVKSCQIQSSLR